MSSEVMRNNNLLMKWCQLDVDSKEFKGVIKLFSRYY